MEDEQPAPARRRNIGFATAWAVAIGFSCIVVGQLAEQFAGIPRSDAPARLAVTGAAAPPFDAIDYSATGAIKRPALAPCGPQANGP
jgi:hypothetical protein